MLIIYFGVVTDVEESDKISKTIKIDEDEIHVAELVDLFAKPDPSVCRYLMNYTKKVRMCFCSFYVKLKIY